MLARRFSIVCLVVAIFGMGLSTMVAQTDRSGVASTHAHACGGLQALRCGLSVGR